MFTHSRSTAPRIGPQSEVPGPARSLHTRTHALPQPANAPTNTGSFAQQLAAAIQNYLGSTTSGAGIHIDIVPNGSQNSGTRQFVVTVTDPAAPPATVPASRGAQPAAV